VSAVPAVSVLMTAYNRQNYVGSAIESVLAQTFADLELLIVDDCSGDKTVDVARKYEADPRVRVVVNERNLGQFPNRNLAARLARGRFLKYHDSDDLMYPHCLATMVPPLAAEPRAGFALSGSAGWVGGPCPMLLNPRMCYQREFLGIQGMFMCGPACALFRTEAFHALGGFPELGVGSDYVFWLKACASQNVLLVPGNLFWYRIHPGQELQKKAATAEYELTWSEGWRALAAPDCPLDVREREQAKRNWAFQFLKNAYQELRRGRWRPARSWLRHAGLSWIDWLRYLRPPRRSPLAGTPLDQTGEYLIPEWPMHGRGA
jgi:hypothetical protein